MPLPFQKFLNQQSLFKIILFLHSFICLKCFRIYTQRECRQSAAGDIATLG